MQEASPQALGKESARDGLARSGDKLSQVLGSGAIGQIAQQCGVSPGVAAGGLAQMLPQIINHLTPADQVPDNHGDLLSQAMAALARNKV